MPGIIGNNLVQFKSAQLKFSPHGHLSWNLDIILVTSNHPDLNQHLQQEWHARHQLGAVQVFSHHGYDFGHRALFW